MTAVRSDIRVFILLCGLCGGIALAGYVTMNFVFGVGVPTDESYANAAATGTIFSFIASALAFRRGFRDRDRCLIRVAPLFTMISVVWVAVAWCVRMVV